MGINYNPRTITDGLVLCLDAANRKSYPESGTTWTDLSGNGNTGTFTSGLTYSSVNGGVFNFDGGDASHIQIINTAGQVDFPGDFTVGLWIYPTQYHRTYQTMIDTYPGGATNGWIFTTMYGGTPVISWYTEGSNWQPSSTAVTLNAWNYVVASRIGTTVKLYKNATEIRSHSDSSNIRGGVCRIGRGLDDANNYGNVFGRISVVQIYKGKGLTAAEILQNYSALKGRFPTPPTPEYETLTYTASGNLTVTGNGTNTVNIFKTSGGNAWDNQAYSLVPFTAPCTIEFNKQAASGDNGASYAMIGWNADPLTNASYTTLDYASYPYRTDVYSVYHNSTQVHFSGSWSTANKFYVVYGTDGTIKHYNGSTLLYSVNYGTGNTVYVDSSFYSPNATSGGFSNIKVIRSAWNGTTYVG